MGASSRGSGSKCYADWLGDDTCKNDGGAPSYSEWRPVKKVTLIWSCLLYLLVLFAVVQNPTHWLYDRRSTCCSAHYSWKIDECLGTTTTTSGLYYPDWSGDNEGCLNDGNEVSAVILRMCSAFCSTSRVAKFFISNVINPLSLNTWLNIQACGCTSHSKHALRPTTLGFYQPAWVWVEALVLLSDIWAGARISACRIVSEPVLVEA